MNMRLAIKKIIMNTNDNIGQVIIDTLSVLLFNTIDRQGVVIVLRITDQSVPLVPAWWNSTHSACAFTSVLQNKSIFVHDKIRLFYVESYMIQTMDLWTV